MDDDVYQSRQDPAITVGFRVDEPGSDLDGAYLLIWTTTPWTLPSNQAVAVNPEVTYVVVRVDDRRLVLAQARLAAYARELGEDPEVLATLSGEQLLGLRYLPPFPYFMDSANAFQVLRGDFVTTEDGTGVVHMVAGLRRGRQGHHRHRRHRAGHPGGLQGPFRRHRARTIRASTSSTPTRRSSAI